jgi:hypothetical protein
MRDDRQKLLLDNLTDEYADLKKWFSRMKFGYENILTLLNEDSVTLKLFTGETEFTINAKPLKENGDSYLGCTSSARKPLVGETWTRGSDLYDGEYSEDTFNRIMLDIVGHSLDQLEQKLILNKQNN